ncbi:T9SS sorting signal type C domain-containing protein [Formosa algae]|uniref:T9SS sorting signal type C domain-containing protein n=1 Tax=Formosa algae TaxID=225843 RepID=UPI001552344B|nr:T9SS sorting signal type C domain-containing protein [Formosa algae]
MRLFYRSYNTKHLYLFLIFGILSITAFGQTWTGNSDTNWNNTSNWSPNSLPTINTDVVINYPSRYPIIDGINAVAKSITIAYNGSLTIQNGGELTVQNDFSTNSPIYISDGELIVGGDLYTTNNIEADNSTIEANNFELANSGNGALIIDQTTLKITEDINVYKSFDTGVLSNIYANNINFYNSNSSWLIDETNVYISNDFYSGADVNLVNGSYVQTKNLELLDNDRTWVLNDTSTLTVEEEINLRNKITLNDNASLIQTSDTDLNTYANNYWSGGLIVNRTASNIKNYDYVYWSSPVERSELTDIANTSHRYKWIPTTTTEYTSNFGNWEETSEQMTIGKGYIVRVGTSGAASTFSQTFTAEIKYDSDSNSNKFFKINNGPISIPVYRGDYNSGSYSNGPSATIVSNEDDNWNLVGNPYPSAISVETFLTENENVIEGGVRIWTHGTEIGDYDDPFYQDFVQNYTASDYITYTSLGSSVPPPPPGSGSDYIASCQGFFVSMRHDATSGTNLNFTNAMRTYDADYTNSEFYRTDTSTQKSRIWLSFTADETKSYNSMLIGYAQGATNDKDPIYDAVIMDHNIMSIYSLVNEEPLVIQGRSLPFLDTDKVPLGIITLTKDLYTIGISKTDGAFENNQDIYLEDLYENTIHNLKDSAYAFTSEAGTFNDRFILRYQDSTLSVDDVITDSSLKIIATENFIKASTASNTINSIIVYDILGRVLYQANGLNTTQVKLDQLAPTQSPLIVKATLINGTTKTQKVIY